MSAVRLDLTDLVRRLEGRLRELLRGPALTSSGGILSVTVAVPELRSAAPARVCADSVYWARPSHGHYRFGLGRVAAAHAAGPERLLALDAAFARLCDACVRLDPDAVDRGPCAFAGFAFDSQEDAAGGEDHDLPNAFLWVPAVLFERHDGTTSLTFACRTGAGVRIPAVIETWRAALARLQDCLCAGAAGLRDVPHLARIGAEPADEAWLERVRGAVQAIRSGALEKVVLTRRVSIEASRALDPGGVLRWLERRYADCVLFGVGGADGSSFLGVSPERLVALTGDRVESDALAGTAPRAGRSDADARCGAALLADPKAQHEHRLVVDCVMQDLAPVCRALEAPLAPRLLRLPTVQHLWTPIRGRVAADRTLLQLAHRLHPTPAVGGVPRGAALRWLASAGEVGRGWYTGGLGWLTADGGGELSVILRCARLRERRAELYAGAGIVADSDPGVELEETEWKLRTMLDALAAG